MPSLDIDINATHAAFAMPMGSRQFRPRYNSAVFTKRVNADGPLVPPEMVKENAGDTNYPKFGRNWDADLRSYKYLNDLLATAPNCVNQCADVAREAGTPAQDMTEGQLNEEVVKILNLALERENRFVEVIDQDDGDGAINYWLGLLSIDPGRHPATNLMVRVGRRVGEYVVMCLKDRFGSPRPSQLCPAIAPMIDAPATPSFPAGHAVQAYLISYLLAGSLPALPQHDLSDPKNPKGPLFDLAARVSQNRIVAGIHYPTDIAAGKAVALKCYELLQGVKSLWGDKTEGQKDEDVPLQHHVRMEFPQYLKR